jgi:hypothetical protein
LFRGGPVVNILTLISVGWPAGPIPELPLQVRCSNWRGGDILQSYLRLKLDPDYEGASGCNGNLRIAEEKHHFQERLGDFGQQWDRQIRLNSWKRALGERTAGAPFVDFSRLSGSD